MSQQTYPFFQRHISPSKTNLCFDGTLSHWQDDRGFGFIKPSQGGEHVFVHIKSFKGLKDDPELNQRVVFEVVTTRNGKRQAVNVRVDSPLGDESASQNSAYTMLAWIAGCALMGSALVLIWL